jgi:outer membrane usher protein FimD/PapC
VNAYASFSGAVVADGGSVLLAQRIDDAFAVVDAGAREGFSPWELCP